MLLIYTPVCKFAQKYNVDTVLIYDFFVSYNGDLASILQCVSLLKNIMLIQC